MAHATATPSAPTFTYYSVSGGAEQITVGPDGNLWFTATAGVGKMTLQGSIAEYPLPPPSPSFNIPPGSPLSLVDIVAGPDGNLWFTAQATILAGQEYAGLIGKVSTGGSITEYETPAGFIPSGIAAGPDGNLWFYEALENYATEEFSSNIGKISPSGSITTYNEYDTAAVGPLSSGIVAGPDGNLWFGSPCVYQCPYQNAIEKITPQGTATQYRVPLADSDFSVNSIVSGPDEDLWFTANGFSNGFRTTYVGKISTSGTSVIYPLPANAVAVDIAAGPDGNFWFTDQSGNGKIGKITPQGVVTEYPLAPAKGGGSENPTGIVLGPDGNLWFTYSSGIGKITL